MDMNITSVLFEKARLSPSKVAFYELRGGTAASVTYGELMEQVLAAATWVRENVPEQANVAILAKGSVSQLVWYFGTASANRIFVPLNWRLPLDELTRQVTVADVAVVLGDDEFADSVAEICRRTGSFQRHVDDLPSYGSDGKQATLESALRIPGDAAQQIIFTSGTSGPAKPAVLTHAGAVWNAVNTRFGFDIPSDEVNLTPLPFFHVGGTFFAFPTLYAGGTSVVLPEYEPAAVWQAIRDFRVTHVFVEATMALRMIDTVRNGLEVDGSSVRRFWWSPQYVSEENRRHLGKFLGCEPGGYAGYGMTESTGLIAIGPTDQQRTAEGSCGRLLPNMLLQLMRDGEPVEDGEAGEAWLRGPNLFAGYYQDPEATSKVFDGTWFRTGDVLRRCFDGSLFFVDRLKDIVKTGGENVSASAVERVLREHPGIEDAAVIGVPHEQWGEAICAVIVGADRKQPPSAQEIVDFARGALAGFQVPRRVEYVDELPRSTTGKLQKQVLKERFR